MTTPIFATRFDKRLATTLISLPLLVFTFILMLVLRNVTHEHETELMKKLHSFSHPTLDRIMLIITDTGSGGRYLPLILVLLWYWRRGLRSEVLTVATVVGGAQVTSWGIKASVQRTRPNAFETLRPTPHDTSFPSGHTLGAAGVYGSIGITLWRQGQRFPALCLMAWTFPVAFSRVYLGFHFPTDVLASIMLGISWLTALVVGADYQNRKEAAL